MLVAAIIGGLYLVVDKYRDIDEGVARSVGHVESMEPVVEAMEETVEDLVGDLQEQRQVDAEFRDKALKTIGDGFEKHDQRIEQLEDVSKEQLFLIREQRTLQQIEKERIQQVEEEQKRLAEEQTRAERATRRAVESLRDRPVDVIVPLPPPE